jgi:hypothetical protein
MLCIEAHLHRAAHGVVRHKSTKSRMISTLVNSCKLCTLVGSSVPVSIVNTVMKNNAELLIGDRVAEDFPECIKTWKISYWQKYEEKNKRRRRVSHQGCQMVYFKTKKPNMGIFWRALEWKMLVYFRAVWYNIHWPFDIVCGHLVYFFRFGMFGPIKIWQTC